MGAAVLALGRDFGDAPDSYATLNASDGARHIRVPEYYLGAGADSEADGTPGVDDGDDGVTFPALYGWDDGERQCHGIGRADGLHAE